MRFVRQIRSGVLHIVVKKDLPPALFKEAAQWTPVRCGRILLHAYPANVGRLCKLCWAKTKEGN